MNITEQEPVITANSIVAFISAAIVLAITFGLSISEEQKAAILGVVVIVAPLVAAWWARRKVTPLAEPKDEDGSPLVRRADGQPTYAATRAMARR